jgi:hypothetical protein
MEHTKALWTQWQPLPETFQAEFTRGGALVRPSSAVGFCVNTGTL